MIASRFARLSAAMSVAAVVVLLGACASSGGASDDEQDSSEPTETAEVLTTKTLVGTWGSTAEHHPNLTFDEEGGVTGTDGCNRLVGSWTLDGDSVTLSDVVTTLMACEDVDTWLSGVSSAQLADDDDELQIFDAEQNEIGTLERAD
ncbi:heat shock protein HslJ [Okibacterium sp. HSC-33S16]|uniref:META domain-containing protein n=1 Tax=Okibacterium sp. HSC-33S16 TaxID=2910965 RepID=UPI00209D5899|nr:META domain-containing protein [Okibacterium sp. HSC-33S16]MCP2032897.1 heat shock protein HslJ [Okibacterium sp. HSC-33S16]